MRWPTPTTCRVRRGSRGRKPNSGSRRCLLSFMSESRRLVNTRMKRELRVRLRYPLPQRLLDEVAPRDLKKQLALPL